MIEADVTLTDYFLTAECGLFTWLLLRTQSVHPSLKNYCVSFFVALGIASLAGGTVHGFFLDESTWGYHVLWRLTLIAIGFVSYFSLRIGAESLGNEFLQRLISRAGAIVLFLYAAYTIIWDQRFLMAILSYLPSSLFLLVALIFRVRQTAKGAHALKGIIGLLITFVASAIQQFKVVIHPQYFNHNAFYHLLQAIALAFLYTAFRGLVAEENLTGRTT